MRITCFLLCVLGLASLALADSGFFVPKAFFKLDNEGHKSDVVQINPHQANILRRLRRQTSFSGSSSSSSTSFGDDDGTHFTTHQVVQQTPDLASRFGGDSRPTGIVHHASGVIKNGRVIYHTKKTDQI